jgi:hypothetical protein
MKKLTLLGVAALFSWGIQVKSNSIFVGAEGAIFHSHNWESIGNSHWTGGGLKVGYYFYIPNAYSIFNRFYVGAARGGNHTSYDGVESWATLTDYYVGLDWVVPVTNLINPYFGVGYHWFNLDITEAETVQWSGPALNLGILFFWGPHFEWEVGGSYIYSNEVNKGRFPKSAPSWKFETSLNYSF